MVRRNSVGQLGLLGFVFVPGRPQRARDHVQGPEANFEERTVRRVHSPDGERAFGQEDHRARSSRCVRGRSGTFRCIFVVVKDPDAGGIPSQFPVQEDTQFCQILRESLDFFGIDEGKHKEYFLVDYKTRE